MMKKFSLLFCAVAAMSLTACLKDQSNTYKLSPEEVQASINSIKGDYSGIVVYNAASRQLAVQKLDTAQVEWSFTSDSTLTIKDFPTAFLATHIQSESIRTAVADQKFLDIDCYFGIVRANPVQFIVNPVGCAVPYVQDGKIVKVHIAFFVNNSYSFGQLVKDKNLLQMHIIEAAIYVDDVRRQEYFPSSVLFHLEGKKK